jgi:hypothetical protein
MRPEGLLIHKINNSLCHILHICDCDFARKFKESSAIIHQKAEVFVKNQRVNRLKNHQLFDYEKNYNWAL